MTNAAMTAQRLIDQRLPDGDYETVAGLLMQSFGRLPEVGDTIEIALPLEAADLVVAGKHRELAQDESHATYEGWFRDAESRINWANHVDMVYNLVRGCNPAPGAWTTLSGTKLQIFDCRKLPVRTFGAVKGKIGEIVECGPGSFQVTAQGGRIERCLPKKGIGKRPGPPPRFSPRDVENMRRLRAEGLLLTVIARRYGINPRTLRRYLRGEVSR